MDSIIAFICQNAEIAHFVIFALLILAGFCVPVSEDLMIVVSAVLAATVVPHHTVELFLAVFLGSYLSDWIAYGLGRFGGGKLMEKKWFAKSLKPKRLAKIHHFYEHYGFWTLLIGRFIPFGVRNALFITAGLGKMPFSRFILADGLACITSNSVLFFLAYKMGQNYEVLLSSLKWFNIGLFAFFAMTGIGVIWYKRKTQKQRPSA